MSLEVADGMAGRAATFVVPAFIYPTQPVPEGEISELSSSIAEQNWNGRHPGLGVIGAQGSGFEDARLLLLIQPPAQVLTEVATNFFVAQ